MDGHVLITGGAGFIGSHTADLLASKGYRIRILDNLEPPVHTGEWPSYVQNKGYDLIKGDVRDKKALLHALQGVDYVLHLAAYQDQMPDYSKFFDVNTTSTAALYELIVQHQLPIKRILYASTQFVYGDGFYTTKNGSQFLPGLRSEENLKNKRWEVVDREGNPATFVPFKEDQQPYPPNSYSLSKYSAEMLALRLGKTNNVPTTIARYSIVQGSRQSPRNPYSGVLRHFVTQSLAKVPITLLYEDGKQLRDFVNVEDVAEANLLLLIHPKANFEIYNVGGGQGYTILGFAKKVKELTRSPFEIIMKESYRRTDARHAVSDISKIGELGWKPRHAPEKAVKEYAAWLLKESFDLQDLVAKQKENLKKVEGSR